ncbi:hypothetical protein AK812_SmicGene3222 [Symbiodinium microadriaticum]|uniref:Uncharacterized protein n=1 Tax=Symbiodinium microadriaticum TaxID=2951 RepID=A0A1Q9EZ48_SYMMI|nr:hypothetical protein AK812_SmicGene3222 [Symbiodinium microadriaticum]
MVRTCWCFVGSFLRGLGAGLLCGNTLVLDSLRHAKVSFMEIADVWLDLFGQTCRGPAVDTLDVHTNVCLEGRCGKFLLPMRSCTFWCSRRRTSAGALAAAVGGAAAAVVVLQVNECRGAGCCCGWRCGCSGEGLSSFLKRF